MGAVSPRSCCFGRCLGLRDLGASGVWAAVCVLTTELSHPMEIGMGRHAASRQARKQPRGIILSKGSRDSHLGIPASLEREGGMDVPYP